jgi:Ca-activated chloride channel family protein
MEHKLIRIGIKGKSIAKAQYPLANFVLLIDVSGSMVSEDKLALLKSGFINFVNQMRPDDKLAIVTYSGYYSVALESTPGTQKDKIIKAIKDLGAGGSTNGSGGIREAYEIAEKNFIPNGNNRVIMGTDGDFNVGITSTDDLVKLIEEQREKGIFLTTLGVGNDNLNDAMMEKIANKGNGNYEYLDNHDELNKVFVDDYSKFLTVAKDVKVQVTFNKNVVKNYRLIGYENRVMESKSFTDDQADAGEIGAGQTITAIYEIEPKGGAHATTEATFTIHFRYKRPEAATSIPIDLDIYDSGHDFAASSENMRFAASVAAFGLYLRKSPYKGNMTLAQIKSWAAGAVSFDPNGYRAKHLKLLEKAM